MKHTELRIGNLVDLYANNLLVKESHEIIAEDFKHIEALCLVGFKPIPLTEDFFKENDFSYSSYIATGDYHVKATKMISVGDYFYNLNVIGIERDLWKLEIESNPKLDIKYRNIVSGSLVNFSYVHKLQNILFELTGKEFKP